MLKKILFLSLTLTFIALASADESSIKKNNTTKYIKGLFPKSCVFTGNFEQKKETENLPLPLISNGQLFFNCKQGLIWKNNEPFQEDTIYTISGFNFRLIVDEPIEQLNGQQYTYLSNLLLDILSADLNAIENKFYLSTSLVGDRDSKKINTEATKDEKYFKLKLIPKNKNIARYLASIDIEKPAQHKNESIKISVNTTNLKSTKIDILNIQYLNNTKHSLKDSKKVCLKYLKELTKNDSSCEILENPKKYANLDSSN